MKTVGIALLFGLCTLLGFRLAEKKTERLLTVRGMLQQLQVFSDEIAAGNGSLRRIAERPGVFFSMLSGYLHALDEGKTESEAAELACAGLRDDGEERAAMLLFFTGLSGASNGALRGRINVLIPALQSVETAAETEAKQGRTFRCIGVLIGAGLAILLI